MPGTMFARLFFAGPALVAMAAPAGAAHWEQIGRTPSGSVWYFDRQSIDTSPTGLHFRVRIDHSADPTEPARTTRGLVRLRCRDKSFHWENMARFAASGRRLSWASRTNEEPVAPDSLMEAVLLRVCVFSVVPASR